jgi:hypothetical protein
VRQPSLSTSVSSHGTSDLHTPNSTVENRPQIWVPMSGTIIPSDEHKSPTAGRDGRFFDPDGDREAGEGPESASASSGHALGRGEEVVETKLEKIPHLELRSPGWIQNEIAGIEDEEMRRLASLAFL